MEVYRTGEFYQIQVIETRLQKDQYKGRILHSIDGTAKGRDVLNFDFESEDGIVEKNDCNLQWDECSALWRATLHDKDNNPLSLEEGMDVESFNELIVSNKILRCFDSWDAAEQFIDRIANIWQKKKEESGHGRNR